MEISVKEAAALLGCTQRTVRNRIARGELRASRQGGRWRISADSLPVSPKVARRLERQRSVAIEAVEKVFSQGKGGRRGDDWGLRGLKVFQATLSACLEALQVQAVGEVAAPRCDAPLTQDLRAGLRLIAMGHVEYDRRQKAKLLQEARRALAAGLAEALLMDGGVPEGEKVCTALIDALEAEVLPQLGGLIKRAEGTRG